MLARSRPLLLLPSFRLPVPTFSRCSFSTAMSDAQPPATTPADLVADPARVSDLRHNLHDVQAAVSQAEAETEASSNRRVQLVAVSKYMPERDIQALYDAGQRHFGENYVQELLRKAEIVS